MMEDTFESMEDGEDMEEAVEEEVDKILFDITAGMMPTISWTLNKQLQTMTWVIIILAIVVLYIKKQSNLTVVYVLLLGALGKAPSKVTDALPDMEAPGATAASEDESEEDIEEMQSRLAALRS